MCLSTWKIAFSDSRRDTFTSMPDQLAEALGDDVDLAFLLAVMPERQRRRGPRRLALELGRHERLEQRPGESVVVAHPLFVDADQPRHQPRVGDVRFRRFDLTLAEVGVPGTPNPARNRRSSTSTWLFAVLPSMPASRPSVS